MITRIAVLLPDGRALGVEMDVEDFSTTTENEVIVGSRGVAYLPMRTTIVLEGWVLRSFQVATEGEVPALPPPALPPHED